MVEELWQKMDTGGFSTTLRTNILQFNGGLFFEGTALPLRKNQLRLLVEAARPDFNVYIEYWGMDTADYKIGMLKKQQLYQ